VRTLREPFLYKTIRAEQDGRVIEGECSDETRHTITIDGKRLIKRNYRFVVDGHRFAGSIIDKNPADRITLERKTK
jgi:RNase P/RNase MRP subunit p29